MTIILGTLIIILTASGQVLLKMGANSKVGDGLINQYVIGGYAIFLLTVALSYRLMGILPLKYFTVVMSLTYIAVAGGAWLFLDETISRNRMIGTILIAAGAVVFAMN
jgi:drug/metabolite transporter (DMT)-like permease